MEDFGIPVKVAVTYSTEDALKIAATTLLVSLITAFAVAFIMKAIKG